MQALRQSDALLSKRGHVAVPEDTACDLVKGFTEA